MGVNGKIRIGTIGTGKIVRRFLAGIAKCPLIEYQAVYSRSEEKAKNFAAEYGVEKYYTTLEGLAQDPDIDGVYIASPNFLHCEQAVFLMEHGKHVLVEKPVASNERELERMQQAAQRNHVVFLEAMRSIFAPGYQVIQENLPKLGQIRRATLQYCQYSSRYDNFKKGIIENAFKPELSNGALMDIGVYCVYALVMLFGMPDKIQAQGVFLENGVDGAGTIICIYPDKQAELIYSKITDSSSPSQIQGEKANMLISEVGRVQELTICYRNGETEQISIDLDPDDMVYEAGIWADCILNHKETKAYDQYSRMEMKLMDEARKLMGICFPADKGTL